MILFTIQKILKENSKNLAGKNFRFNFLLKIVFLKML